MLNPTMFCGLNVCITKEVDFCGFYLKMVLFIFQFEFWFLVSAFFVFNSILVKNTFKYYVYMWFRQQLHVFNFYFMLWDL